MTAGSRSPSIAALHRRAARSWLRTRRLCDGSVRRPPPAVSADAPCERARPCAVEAAWDDEGIVDDELGVSTVLETPPRFVLPLAGPLGAVLLGAIAILSVA